MSVAECGESRTGRPLHDTRSGFGYTRTGKDFHCNARGKLLAVTCTLLNYCNSTVQQSSANLSMR